MDHSTDLKSSCEDASLPVSLSHERLQWIHQGETMLTLTDLMLWATTIPYLTRFVADAIDHILTAERGVDHDPSELTRPVGLKPASCGSRARPPLASEDISFT
jgi:hypothetical protein